MTIAEIFTVWWPMLFVFALLGSLFVFTKNWEADTKKERTATRLRRRTYYNKAASLRGH
jgi:hypothetical protein